MSFCCCIRKEPINAVARMLIKQDSRILFMAIFMQCIVIRPTNVYFVFIGLWLGLNYRGLVSLNKFMRSECDKIFIC